MSTADGICTYSSLPPHTWMSMLWELSWQLHNAQWLSIHDSVFLHYKNEINLLHNWTSCHHLLIQSWHHSAQQFDDDLRWTGHPFTQEAPSYMISPWTSHSCLNLWRDFPFLHNSSWPQLGSNSFQAEAQLHHSIRTNCRWVDIAIKPLCLLRPC